LENKARRVKKQKKKQKQQIWFTKVRGSYLPCSRQGWLTYIPFVSYLLASYIVVLKQATSIGAIVFGILPQWVAAAVIMTWIASNKS
jgi:hypothetical protein